MSTTPAARTNRRLARVAAVLAGLACGIFGAVLALHLAAPRLQAGQAGPRDVLRPILWFGLAFVASGFAVERWALAKPIVGRIVVVAVALASPIVIYRIMLLYGLASALAVVVVLAVVVSLVMLFTKEA